MEKKGSCVQSVWTQSWIKFKKAEQDQNPFSKSIPQARLGQPQLCSPKRGNSLYLDGALSKPVTAFRMWGIAVFVSNWVLDKLPQN